MSSAVIYLDESGDLGWKFDAPYRQGGSSRFLTIAALITPADKKQHPKRLIKNLHKKMKWSGKNEKKWSGMSGLAKIEFSNAIARLCTQHKEIKCSSIIVRKENVQPHIRVDSNKLYNYMIKLMLINQMSQYQHVTLVPDPRSIEVASGNSLHDYLQTELWMEKNAATILNTNPQDSINCLGLQLVDMLSGAIRERYEDNKSGPLNIIRPHVMLKTLFF